MSITILGIDPALTNLGWGVISSNNQKIAYIASGVISSQDTKTLMPFRLAKIITQLESIVDLYKPNVVVMEETFINKNAISSLKLGYTRGAIMALIGKLNVIYAEYKPNLIKKTVVGSGHADKAQVLHMIKLIINGASHVSNYDQADALAIAYTYSVLYKFHQLTQ